MRYQGHISSWNDDKGFGFITPNGGDKQIFVHINSFTNRGRRPAPAGNEIVTYQLGKDEKGKPHAHDVQYLGERTYNGPSNFPLWLVIGFSTCLGVLYATGRLPKLVAGIYFIASIMTLIAYYLDKSAAKKNSRRTPESTLHTFSLFGGWPGAVLAQRFMRHKSQKSSFQITFWVTVVLNCGALSWWILSR